MLCNPFIPLEETVSVSCHWSYLSSGIGPISDCLRPPLMEAEVERYFYFIDSEKMVGQL